MQSVRIGWRRSHCLSNSQGDCVKTLLVRRSSTGSRLYRMWGMIGPTISADWVGRVIDGRFALLEWLGGGAHGGVFRTELPQPVEKRATITLIASSGNEADSCIAGWA